MIAHLTRMKRDLVTQPSFDTDLHTELISEVEM